MSAPQPHTWLDDLKAFEPLISWTLLIAGWIFVRWDNNKREDRHELRSTIDSLIGDIKALEQKAYQYYTKDAADPSIVILQVEIKRDQHLIEARFELLRKLNKRFQNIEKLSVYRGELTGGDFEQVNRQKRPATDGKLKEISFAAKQLIDELESEYGHQIYKK